MTPAEHRHPDAAQARVRDPVASAAIFFVGLAAAPALLIHAGPEILKSWMVFDRQAIAGGELWRLFTGHWVHFGGEHLILNLGTLVVFGLWLCRLAPEVPPRFLVLAAPVVSAALWVLEPDMARFGGLSGLGAGLVTLAALTGLSKGGSRWIRWVCACLLALVILKAGTDLAGDRIPGLHAHLDGEARISRWAHAAGGLVGGAYALVSACRWRGPWRRPGGSPGRRSRRSAHPDASQRRTAG
jgi:rhomboid family GlyGly-CTERM serine protease